MAEVDTFFDGNHRRPDIAYLTDEQVEAGKIGGEVVPLFVIEVISGTDQMNKVDCIFLSLSFTFLMGLPTVFKFYLVMYQYF